MPAVWFDRVMEVMRRGAVFAVVGLSIGFVSCYPGQINSLQETDVVITGREADIDFTAFNSFTMLDTIVHLVDSTATDTVELGRQLDTEILALIAQRLQAYGYTRIDSADVTPDNLPDVFVTVAASASNNWVFYVTYPWWGYWGWWGGWPGWGPGWGPGYPCCGSVGATNYLTGSLIIDMYDVARADTVEREFPTPWNTVINGMLGGSEQLTAQRLERTINQAFDQSPYLQTAQPTPQSRTER